MKLIFKNRDFSDMIIQPGVEITIDRYSWASFGGPEAATIQAAGSSYDLFKLINNLRAPVEIINDLGEAVWWGYLSELTIHIGNINYGVDLETMYNNLAVAYTDQGIRYTTEWSGDSESIGEYGQKEILLSKSDVTEADALQCRDTYLANTKYPIPTLKFSSGEAATATLTLKGWYKTLSWRYYANAVGKESYETTGTGGREVGEDDRPKLAQSFRIGASTAWAATSIWLRVWKQGTDGNLPIDELQVYILADNNGPRGEILAANQTLAADIGTSADWMEFVLTTPVLLQPGVTYWIEVNRSGNIDASAYYMLDTNIDAGYPRGQMYLWNESMFKWGPDVNGGNWGDLLFKLVGDTQTSDQIATLVATVGQFFEGTIMENESGLESNPYRNGDTVGSYELEKLLNTGTVNDRRMLCEVTRSRYLRVYEEPAKPSNARASYALNADGVLMMENLTAMDQSLCPVGIWCHLQDVIPASVDLSLISDPTLFLVEEAEYDVKAKKYNILATRNQSDAMDIGGTVQG